MLRNSSLAKAVRCFGSFRQISTAINTYPGDSAAQLSPVQRKLLYRSKQRGFLELDLLIGLWAEKNIAAMDTDTLKHLSIFLDEENPDLFKWMTGQLEAPELMANNSVFMALKRDVGGRMEMHMAPNCHSTNGKEWVRGWDDAWRKSNPEAKKPLQ